MNKHKTKYFGEIELSIEQDGCFADFDTIYSKNFIECQRKEFTR